MKNNIFVIIYMLILAIGTTTELFANLHNYPQPLLFGGFLFALLLLISVVGYILNKNTVIVLAQACLSLYTIYALIGFIWFMTQDQSMIIPLIITLLVIISLNLSVIFHMKNKIEFNSR